jgi:hypothetical protein
MSIVRSSIRSCFPVRLAAFAAAALVAVLAARPAEAQCGSAVTGRFGGETGAAAQINISTLAVGRGSVVELIDISNTNLPAVFNPARTMGLPAPATKIVHTPGSNRLFVLMESGAVCMGTLSFAPGLGVGSPVTVNTDDAVDIVADGTRVCIVRLDEDEGGLYSYVDIYDGASGALTYVRFIPPFLDNHGFDRAVKVGDVLWLGMHEFESSIMGVEAWNIANPSAPVRVTTSLSNAPLGSHTRISAMTAVGSRLLMSYRHSQTFQSDEDWLRAVDIAVPGSPVWHPGADLNGTARCMASTGTRLRIAIEDSGVGTWETANPAALAYMGGYFDSFPRVSQMIAVGAIDYWAGGRAGLMTMNTFNPAAVTARANLTPVPIGPSVVRQAGNTTAVLDYTLNALRLFDYTLPEPQQHRSSINLPLYAELVELGVGAAGVQTLACVATRVPNSTTDSITIYDITNPAAPFVRATIPNVEARLLSVVNSRMYVLTSAAEFRIYELSQQPPQLRSTTPFGGTAEAFTCLTGWEAGATKAVALGTNPFGLWIINVTDAINPLVSSIYNPVSNYRVHALAKGNNYLYISARIEGETPGSTAGTRLESLTVTNLAAPVSRFVVDRTRGPGSPGVFDDLAYIAAPSGKFLVGTQADSFDGPVGNSVVVYDLPPGFLFNEAIPFKHPVRELPHATGRAARNADGSRFMLAGGPAGLYQVSTPAQWAPAYGVQNFDQTACYGATATFTTFVSANPADVTFRWHRYGPPAPGGAWVSVPLSDGPTGWGSTITGSAEFSLSISNLRPDDRRFYYYVVATSSCGATPSFYADLRMCPADFNCSGDDTVQDIFDFMAAYFAGLPTADFNGIGGITIQDLFDFLAAYFAGCV